ncbi:MAG: ribosome biogenesis GTP-binding protein YihA/YsxC [Bacteroidota bacterium]|nr:ribosome biogenesis GTP-binding protein YihA/YsxC [Bacteroidota bacterium]
MQQKQTINSAEYVSSNPSWETLTHSNHHEYAFIGRSNVGKSSLINMLTNRKNLALTSKTPGKTKMINLFLINNKWNLIDLPGFGYAKVSKNERYNWGQSIYGYFSNRKNLVSIFVLVDPNIPPQAIDIDFINYLGEQKLPFTIVFTKCDKSGAGKLSKNIQDFENQLLRYWDELPQTFKTSANKHQGKEKLLEYIFHLNENIRITK